ncbi:hypothetical protein [Streptomyces fuscigenes]|uniref:hypothetical protein n=1 Tax=Streptomyces fuscigenes TaxID=1528880 RepID=UPI001F4855CD|nr:hypothetical protein [Streptomyces fuscigenes]MCF3965162.1 hypothetical protein [Streptomyces fuscigenes]
METTSQATDEVSDKDEVSEKAEKPVRGDAAAQSKAVDGYLKATFPWYGLDAAYTGPRTLMQAVAAADGTVQHGAVRHGSEPAVRPESPAPAAAADEGEEGDDRQRFAVVITVAASPARRSGDGTGQLDATTASSAAWLAGSGLLACTWPGQLDHTLRDDWLNQQTETAFELADDLDSPEWSTLSLPVDGVPTPFRYRESEYGWVLAGSTDSVHLGAYGRGMSAYGLGFARIEDLRTYEG